MKYSSSSIENIFQPSKAATEVVKFGFRDVDVPTWRLRLSSTSLPTNNWRNNELHDLISLLENMSDLDADDSFHVGGCVRDRAIKLLIFIARQHHVDFPKILPEGEDCLSLTWDKGALKSFITIYPDEVESTLFNRTSGLRCVYQISDGDEINFSNVSRALAETPVAKTVDVGDVSSTLGV